MDKVLYVYSELVRQATQTGHVGLSTEALNTGAHQNPVPVLTGPLACAWLAATPQWARGTMPLPLPSSFDGGGIKEPPRVM